MLGTTDTPNTAPTPSTESHGTCEKSDFNNQSIIDQSHLTVLSYWNSVLIPLRDECQVGTGVYFVLMIQSLSLTYITHHLKDIAKAHTAKQTHEGDAPHNTSQHNKGNASSVNLSPLTGRIIWHAQVCRISLVRPDCAQTNNSHKRTSTTCTYTASIEIKDTHIQT